MNVPFNKINAKDAADMIGVDYTTVLGWCKKGIINYSDISDGTGRPRYQLDEEEIECIKKLKKKHGTRKAMLYYKKDWNNKPVKKKEDEWHDDSHIFLDEAELFSKQNEEFHQEPEVKEEETQREETQMVEPQEYSYAKDDFNVDKITNTILYIREVKERLNDLEAEKAQLLNELESLRKEVMDAI